MRIKPVYLKWDSQQLGLKCGLLQIDNSSLGKDSTSVKDLLEYSDVSRFDLVVYKLPARHISAVNRLISNGASLIDIELIYRYPKQTPPHRQAIGCPDMKFIFCKKYDPRHFLSLANDMIYSRFFLDRNIDKKKAISIWRESLKNHCLGFADRLLIAFYNHKPCGITVMQFKRQECLNLHIVGIVNGFRNLGIGRTMLNVLKQEFASDFNIFVQTSSKNLAAQQLYQRCGFKLHALRFILHHWKDRG